MSEVSTIRTKWMDPDFRPRPKTNHHCIMCGRDLKPTQPHREVRWELDIYEAIHPEDWERAKREISRPIEQGVLGMDCARNLGLEWSR
jgi:hypothetical protein